MSEARRKHGPNRLGNYLQIHETIMHNYVLGDFVLEDGLRFESFGDGAFTLNGSIQCLGPITIDVSKEIEILSGTGADAIVQTQAYSYNAVLDGTGVIVRYDSPHFDHNQFHHVHRYDVLAGDTNGSLTAIKEDAWPTLGEVIDEVRGWYYDNLGKIGSL